MPSPAPPHSIIPPPQGTRHPPPLPTPSRFSAVAPLFFFPLLSGFDRPSPCLDLLARDSLLLGNLLYTVGVVMHASTHSPAAPSMASALMDFVWALRYHTSRWAGRLGGGGLSASTPAGGRGGWEGAGLSAITPAGGRGGWEGGGGGANIGIIFGIINPYRTIVTYIM